MSNLIAVMKEADQAYEEVIESGGGIQQAAVAYLATSTAGRSGDAERIEAARYVTLYQCYLVNPRMAVTHDEYRRLRNKFSWMGWNYSNVERYALTGKNSHTDKEE